MKKFVFVLVFITLSLLLAGCNEQVEEQKKAFGLGETIQDVLEKAESIENLSYEVSLSTPELQTEQKLFKIYEKNNKWKMEHEYNGRKVTSDVFDGKNYYIYYHAEDKYYKTDFLQKHLDLKDMSKQALEDPNLKEIGEEEINGLKSRIIEFNYKDKSWPRRIKVKVWISEEHGIPLKMEFPSPVEFNDYYDEYYYEFFVYVKNLNFDSIEDSVFQVPSEKIFELKEEVCEETEKPYSEETIEEIIAKAENVTNIEYEQIYEVKSKFFLFSGNNYLFEKYYRKGTKWKNEEVDERKGVRVDWIFDDKNVYSHWYGDEFWVKRPKWSRQLSSMYENSKKFLEDPSLKEIGKERICGLNTRIIEVDNDEMSKFYGQKKAKNKVWISEDYGIIIKIESEGETVKSIWLRRNIKLGSVEDSLFEVPEDNVRTAEEVYG
ncbi:MAG: hypothetical protein ABIJ74_00520, partial [archaeon]